MAPIEASFVRLGARIVSDFLRDAASLLHPEGLVRAFGTGQMLTREQIEDLKTLIRQHYVCHVFPDYRRAFWKIPEEQVWRWRNAGVVGPTGAWALTEPIDDAVLAARLAEVLDTGTSYRKMLQIARERPASRVEELARQIARDRTWVALDALAWRHADTLGRMVITARQREIGGLVSDYLGGTLKHHDRTVQGNRGLATALRDRMKSKDIERDWLRVAVSETNWATNYATLVHLQEEEADLVYFLVQPTACDDCKRIYLHPDGTPKVFRLGDLLEEVAFNGGTNVGRARKDWKATALLHPWCRCRPVRYVRGLPYVPTGDLRKETGI